MIWFNKIFSVFACCLVLCSLTSANAHVTVCSLGECPESQKVLGATSGALNSCADQKTSDHQTSFHAVSDETSTSASSTSSDHFCIFCLFSGTHLKMQHGLSALLEVVDQSAFLSWPRSLYHFIWFFEILRPPSI